MPIATANQVPPFTLKGRRRDPQQNEDTVANLPSSLAATDIYLMVRERKKKDTNKKQDTANFGKKEDRRNTTVSQSGKVQRQIGWKGMRMWKEGACGIKRGWMQHR